LLDLLLPALLGPLVRVQFEPAQVVDRHRERQPAQEDNVLVFDEEGVNLVRVQFELRVAPRQTVARISS
jgi:hypothetical protein